jgi:uncharacterized membrane protein YjgN (DUF898 family)
MHSRTLTFKLFEKRLVAMFIVASLIFGVSYSYFLVSSIVNVIVREEAEHDIAVLGSQLSEIEYAYIKRQDAINIGLARSLGFTALEKKHFVTRRGVLGQSRTFGDEN